MSSKFLIALTAACIAFAPCAMAEPQTGPGASEGKNVGDVKEGQAGGQAGRMGGGGGKSKPAARMGGGGGKSKDPAKAINLNSSRSNTY